MPTGIVKREAQSRFTGGCVFSRFAVKIHGGGFGITSVPSGPRTIQYVVPESSHMAGKRRGSAIKGVVSAIREML